MTPELKAKLNNLQEECRRILALDTFTDEALADWAKTADDWIWLQIQRERHRRGIVPDVITTRDGGLRIRLKPLPVM